MERIGRHAHKNRMFRVVREYLQNSNEEFLHLSAVGEEAESMDAAESCMFIYDDSPIPFGGVEIICPLCVSV